MTIQIQNGYTKKSSSEGRSSTVNTPMRTLTIDAGVVSFLLILILRGLVFGSTSTFVASHFHKLDKRQCNRTTLT